MFKIIFLTICFLFTNLHALEKLKVGVLAFGTVNWELDVLKHNKLDIKNGFELEVVKLASKNATSIALQSGSVDIIVTDWVWVNTQRANGGDTLIQRQQGLYILVKIIMQKPY
jgi:NitT/TauT family transport system substrate-binding protein